VKLWAIADLHVGYAENRAAVEATPAHPDDWLIVAGDTGDTPAQLDFVLKTLTPRFRQLVWVPGNHELWTPRNHPIEHRGDAHYQRLVSLCQRHGVLTPEDPYALWPGDGPPRAIAPLFLLFDYSFAPGGMVGDAAVDWAARDGLRSADEELLDPHPFESRAAWCHARVRATAARLDQLPRDVRLIVVNHYPFRAEHAVLPRIPRFRIWCGTRLTEEWHRTYNVEAVVYGHLHLRASHERDGVRFEEVSLGYPRQWDPSRGIKYYLRQIL
jgi:3',5'-cyclic AMP phosphodiesterase CpdA